MSNQMKKWFPLFCLLCLVIVLSSCKTAPYYKPVVIDTPGVNDKGMAIQDNLNRYAILRMSNRAYGITDIVVDTINLSLKGKIVRIDSSHAHYIKAYKTDFRPSTPAIENEMHIYIADTTRYAIGQQADISLRSIDKIEILEFDSTRTAKAKKSTVVTGFVVTGVIIAGIIIVAIASVDDYCDIYYCPTVEVHGVNGFSTEGTFLNGVNMPQLERSDVIPLMKGDVNANSHFRIKNNFAETEYINNAKLLIVQQPDDKTVMLSNEGIPYAVGNIISPAEVISNTNQAILQAIAQKDGMSYLFDDSSNVEGTNDLVFQFPFKGNAERANLILDVKTTPWLNQLFSCVARVEGSEYSNWLRKPELASRDELMNWMNRNHIPLTVSVYTNEGWQEQATLLPSGSKDGQSIVIPLNFQSGHDEKLLVRIQAGFNFWDLDRVGIDYTNPDPLPFTIQNPETAINQDGCDMVAELNELDNSYAINDGKGTFIDMTFERNALQNSDKRLIFFLEASGYYRPHMEDGWPSDPVFLDELGRSGNLAAFGKQQYLLQKEFQSFLVQN